MQRLFFIVFSIAFLASCEHKPILPGKPGGTTGTTGNGGNGGNGGTGGNGGGGGVKCSPDTVYFANEILPLIRSSCAQSGCHDAATRQDGVQLDNYANIINTGEVRAGRPGNSELYEMITENDPDERMPPPPHNPLSQESINKIRIWIQQGARNNACNSGCDSTKFAWTADILPIIKTNCVACHSSGTVLLNSHAGVQTVALNGRLMGAIRHLQGYRPMPEGGGSLSSCDIEKIQKWVNNGAPNN